MCRLQADSSGFFLHQKWALVVGMVGHGNGCGQPIGQGPEQELLLGYLCGGKDFGVLKPLSSDSPHFSVDLREI